MTTTLQAPKTAADAPPHILQLQQAIRQAWRLLIINADDSTELLELPVGQFRCLRRIMDAEGCKLVDLARETNLSLPNASRLVDRLVQRHLVLRETDPNDRRAVRLYVTPEARETINTINQKRMEHLVKTTKGLTGKQIDAAVSALQVIIDAAEQAHAADPKFSSNGDH